MNNLDGKREAVKQLINELRQHRTPDPRKVEQVLTDILEVIRDGDGRRQPEQGGAGDPADLAQENATLQRQIAEREASETQLREANKDLEMQLQAQLEENKRTQALEREQRALTEALRDTIATMSSTLDLNKVLDQILDTVGRVTPYDGANVLFVESDLVHVVRQRGYVEKGQEQAVAKSTDSYYQTGGLAANDGSRTTGGDHRIRQLRPLWIGFPGLDWIALQCHRADPAER